jgi:peroxiredoxin
LRDRIADFEKRGARILAIDPHESYRVRHMLRDVGLASDQLAFPVVADPACVVSAIYGVAFQMRVHTEWSNRPATFLVDSDGIIRFERRGTTYSDRPKPDELLAEIDRLTKRGAAAESR